MYKDRSNDLRKEIFTFKATHAGITHYVKPRLCKTPVISKDIKVVTITNYHTYPLLEQYKNHTDLISYHNISLPTFRCWLDKIEPLLNYIKTITEPYVMYMDATDSILVDDIQDAQEILDTYNCKILFNAEDGFSQPGHPCDPKEWIYSTYYNQTRLDVVKKIRSKLLAKTKTAPYVRSLNAGLYLGEREFIIECLEQILLLMLDDPQKGYPYGESDDQILWQHMQAMNDYENIEIDYNNLFFFWGGERHLDYDISHWEHFNYFNSKNKP
jgi:hypothetical protein